jgi:integrase
VDVVFRDEVEAKSSLYHIRSNPKVGVEHRGLHTLRHSFASNLYTRGVEVKIISKLLGHASVEITYNRYIHFFGTTSMTPYGRRLGCKQIGRRATSQY